METTTTPLEKDQFDAYKELAENDAQSLDDLVTLREMAKEDTGTDGDMLEFRDNGEVRAIPTTDLGKGALGDTVIKSTDVGMAQHGEDYHTEEK